LCSVINILKTNWLAYTERGYLAYNLPPTLLPDARGAVGGPDDADAIFVTAAVTVDADADVDVTTADVSVDVVTVDVVAPAVTAVSRSLNRTNNSQVFLCSDVYLLHNDSLKTYNSQ